MFRSRRRVGVGPIAAACCASAALAVGGTSIASGSSRPLGAPEKPNRPIVIQGFGYSCASTTRQPQWDCWYGKPYGRAGTPITTVWKGSRKMMIQSLRRPSVSWNGSEWVTTLTK